MQISIPYIFSDSMHFMANFVSNFYVKNELINFLLASAPGFGTSDLTVVKFVAIHYAISSNVFLAFRVFGSVSQTRA